MKNMGDYQDHYLKKDILLLADVFEFPGLSWDAMLEMTGAKLEKISDIDIYLFIEKQLRGGISEIAERYAKANKKYIKKILITLM